MPDTSLPGLGKPTAVSSPVRPGQPAQPSAFGQLSGQGQPTAKPDLLGGMGQANPKQLQQLAPSPASPKLGPSTPKPQPAPPSVTPSAAPPSGPTVPGAGSGGPLATAAPPPGGQPQLPGLPSALPPEGGAPPAAMPETPPQQPPGMLEQMFPKAPAPGMGNPAAKPSFTPGQEPGMMDKVLNWAPDALGLDSKEMHPVLKGIMSIGGPALLLMLLTKLFGGRGKEASLRDYTPAEQAEARRRLQRAAGTMKYAAEEAATEDTPADAKPSEAKAERRHKARTGLGSVEQAYVADAMGGESIQRLGERLLQMRQQQRNPGIYDDILMARGGVHSIMGERIQRGASRLADNPTWRMLSHLDPTAPNDGKSVGLIGALAGLGGGPDAAAGAKRRTAEAYRKFLHPHQDKLPAGTAGTARSTPWHLGVQARLANLDADVAGHSYMRREKPWQYWLNPFDATGPLLESGDRMQRRVFAGMAQPESTGGRAAMGFGAMGTLGLLPLLTGGAAAQNKLRASAKQNELYPEAAVPEEAPVKQADLTSDAAAGIDKMLASLGYAKQPPATQGNKQLLQALGLLGGSTALGAGFGALRKPGGSRLRGAVIGGTAGLAGGAGLLGANEFMDSSHMRNVKDTSWQAPTVLGATAGATAGGVGLGRRLASVLGLKGRKDNDPNNDLEELDLTRKFNITPFG